MMSPNGTSIAVLLLLHVLSTDGFVHQHRAVLKRQCSFDDKRGTNESRCGIATAPSRQYSAQTRRTMAMKAKTKSKQSTGTAVTRDQDLAELLRWAGDEIGVKAPKLKGAFNNGLRGLVATQNIGANEEMVIVPSDSALVTTTDQPCPFPEWVDKRYWDKSPWQVRLALLLLREKRNGAEGKLQPWIDRLPEAFGTPLGWSDAELSELQYPHLESEVREQRKNWSALYERLKASSPGCGVTEAELTWAMGVMYSRAFSGPYEGRGPRDRLAELVFVAALAGLSVGLGLGTVDQVANGALAVLIGIPIRDFLMTKLVQLKRYALTPVVDLLNHKSGIDSDVSYNYFYGYFAVTTQRAWEVGEQVFISYGPRSNDHLLQRYGFVERDNPNDVYRIIGLVDKLSSLLGESSVTVLRGSESALGTELVDSLTLGRAGLQGEEEHARVMPALRLAVVQDDQLPEGKMGNISLKDFSAEVSPANEQAARRALLQLCVKERDGLTSDLAQDEHAISTVGNSYSANKKMAVNFRMEKKRVLNDVISALTKADNSSQANGTNSKQISSSPVTA